jgi:DNA-binding Lrp family transcriptional regulator
MMKAYVLIKIHTGDLREAVRNLKSVQGVVEANMTFGPFDAVAIVQADSVNHLGQIVAMGIQPIPGVLETLTCLAVEL